MATGFSRRHMLRLGGVAAAGIMASPLVRWAGAQESKTRKVLFFTKSSGFQHDVVKRKEPDELAFAEKFMVDFGKAHNFDVRPTKDGTIFTKSGLEPFDVIMFYTTGNLTEPGTDGTPPMPSDGKETLLSAVAGGKGFLGLHCASDTFHSPKGGPVDPYIDMLGGEFLTHGHQQDAHIIAADRDFGPIKGLSDFTEYEEWYQLHNLNPEMHVILIQDTASMKQDNYHELKPYPETWARMHGKGRVFYSSMGHRPEVWRSPVFQKVLLGGLQWSAGDADADAKPDLEQLTPGAMVRKG